MRWSIGKIWPTVKIQVLARLDGNKLCAKTADKVVQAWLKATLPILL